MLDFTGGHVAFIYKRGFYFTVICYILFIFFVLLRLKHQVKQSKISSPRGRPKSGMVPLHLARDGGGGGRGLFQDYQSTLRKER